jgi:hypothetical protein
LAIPSHSNINCSIVCFSFCHKSSKEGDTNTQQLKNIRLAKKIGFDLGAITFCQKIIVLLMRILSGLSYNGIRDLNFSRLEPIRVTKW